ncbi:MAG: TetR/AcrR family transcriptional regulator [Robiginitomaculum sp.]
MKNDAKKINYHHGQLAYALVEAGRKIIEEKGQGGLSLRAVASRVGVTQMAPYAHFKNKDELLQAIAASGFFELANNLEESISASSKKQNPIIECGICYIEFAIKNHKIYQLMFSNSKLHNNFSGTESISKNCESLSFESQRAYHQLFKVCKLQAKNDATAKKQASFAWSLAHGTSSLINTGFLIIPDATKLRSFLRDILSTNSKL